MDSRFLSRFHPGWPAISVAAIVCVVALGARLLLRNPAWAQHWIHDQVVSLPDDELAPWLSGLIEQGEPAAIATVVQDLSSQRRALRDAALRVLRAETDRWATLPTNDATQRAVAMAEALQQSPESVRKRSGNELSAKILAWAEHPNCPALSRGRILLALRGFPQISRARTIERDETPPAVEVSARGPMIAPLPTNGDGDANAIAAPLMPDSGDAGSSLRSTSVRNGDGAETPRLLFPSGERRAMDDDEETDWELSPPPDAAEPGEPGRDAVLPDAPLPHLLNDGDQFRAAPTRALIPLLHTDQRAEVARELQLRGFNDEQLELAGHLSSADRKERLQWTEALPRVPNVDARAWLTWMTEDRDAEVRRTAVTLLGTSLDEPTTALLRKLATRDADQSVRRLAAELVQRKSTSR